MPNALLSHLAGLISPMETEEYWTESDRTSGTEAGHRILEALFNAMSDIVRKTGEPTTGNLAAWLDSETIEDAGYAADDVARLSQANTFTGNQEITGNLQFAEMSVGTSPTALLPGLWTEGGPGDPPVLTWRPSDTYISVIEGTGTIHMHGGATARARAAFKETETELNTPLKAGGGIITEDWNTPTLQNGWVWYGAPFASPAYKKDPQGFVHIKGLVRSGTGSTIFTLPPGYRPAEVLHIASQANLALALVRIDNVSGNVDATGSNVWFSLAIPPFEAA